MKYKNIKNIKNIKHRKHKIQIIQSFAESGAKSGMGRIARAKYVEKLGTSNPAHMDNARGKFQQLLLSRWVVHPWSQSPRRSGNHQLAMSSITLHVQIHSENSTWPIGSSHMDELTTVWHLTFPHGRVDNRLTFMFSATLCNVQP